MSANAAGTHLGPCAVGVTGSLKHDVGLTMCKSGRVLQQCFGLSVSCGNQSEQGATNTWAMLTSLAATCAQRGDFFMDQVDQVMSLQPI